MGNITDVHVEIDSDEGKASIELWYDGERRRHTSPDETIDLSFRGKRKDGDHRISFKYRHPNSEKSLRYTLRIMDELKKAYIYPMFGEYVIWNGEVPLTVEGTYEYFTENNENT